MNDDLMLLHPSRRGISCGGLAVLTLLALILAGCENAGQGAVSGAGIGALSGLAIGSLSGDAGKGAAIGAVVGGVGGAVIGDQNRRKAEAEKAEAARQVPPPPATVIVTTVPPHGYSASQALGRLVGRWEITGSIDDGKGGTLPITGSAVGAIDKTYFVRLDLKINDPRSGKTVEGSSVISQTGGRGIEMNNSFSTSPDLVRLRGEMDASGTMFNLGEVSPNKGGRQLVIRLLSSGDWTADMWRDGLRAESFRFSPAGK